MKACLNVNHRLANGSLVQKNLVSPYLFFAVVMEKLAVTKSRVCQMLRWDAAGISVNRKFIHLAGKKC